MHHFWLIWDMFVYLFYSGTFCFWSSLLCREVFRQCSLIFFSYCPFWVENIWMSMSDSKLHTSFPWKGTKKNKQNPNTHTDRFRHSIAHLKGMAVTLTNLMSNIPAGNSKSASFLSLLKGAALIKHAKHFKSALPCFFYKHTQNKLHSDKFVWINAKKCKFSLCP